MNLSLWQSFRPENLRSAWLAFSFMAIVGVIIGVVASFTGMLGSPSPPAEFDVYVNLGSRAGTEALARDLNQQHPAGTDLVPLINRLQRSGFECRADYRQVTSYDCVYNRMMPNRRVARIDATVRTDGMRVQSITPVLLVSVR